MPVDKKAQGALVNELFLVLFIPSFLLDKLVHTYIIYM